MSWQLRTVIYDGKVPSQEDISGVSHGLLIRAAVHGGVQTIEFELADDYIDAYRWAYDHIGCKVYILDNGVTPPVAEGKIFEPAISQDGNRITAYGPWLAYCFSQVYNDTSSWVTTGTTSEQIKDMLTDDCPDVNSNQDNIDETSMNYFPWQPTNNAYPGNLISKLAALSDVSNAEWYFWLQSAPFAGTTPQDPIPWFKSAGNVPGLYTCWREDMAPGGLNLTPSLRELVNDLRVMYRDAVGTANQTASATDADSQARYGLRERYGMDLGLASATAAAQYRDMLLARYKDPQQSANFTLNTWLYDQWGGKWPLWRAIADFPFKLTVNDLIPDTTVLSHTLDHKRTFITLTCEYDYDRNTLTITPDTEDNRADALLARHRTFQ
jgi:hypothetical protein